VLRQPPVWRAAGVAVAVGSAAFLAACGASGPHVDHLQAHGPFSLSASRGCLGQIGVLSQNVGAGRAAAHRGAVQLAFDGARVVLLFGDNPAGAKTLAGSYKDPKRIRETRVAENVALMWANTPAQRDVDAVELCLRSSPTSSQIRAARIRANRARVRARAHQQALKRKKQRAKTQTRPARVTPAPRPDYHSQSQTCELPDAVDRSNCQTAYETCSTDGTYALTPNDGGGRIDSLAVQYANETFGSNSNPAWQGGYAGCLGALLEQSDHFQSG
jgi:hypothetical protein